MKNHVFLCVSQCSWAFLGRSWSGLGAVLGRSWRGLGACWERFEPVLARFGVVLRAPRGRFSAVVWPSGGLQTTMLFTYFYVSSGAPGRSWVGVETYKAVLWRRRGVLRLLYGCGTDKSGVELSKISEDRQSQSSKKSGNLRDL